MKKKLLFILTLAIGSVHLQGFAQIKLASNILTTKNSTNHLSLIWQVHENRPKAIINNKAQLNGKGTSNQERIIASAVYKNGVLTDSSELVYSIGRGSEIWIDNEKIIPIADADTLFYRRKTINVFRDKIIGGTATYHPIFDLEATRIDYYTDEGDPYYTHEMTYNEQSGNLVYAKLREQLSGNGNNVDMKYQRTTYSHLGYGLTDSIEVDNSSLDPTNHSNYVWRSQLDTIIGTGQFGNQVRKLVSIPWTVVDSVERVYYSSTRYSPDMEIITIDSTNNVTGVKKRTVYKYICKFNNLDLVDTILVEVNNQPTEKFIYTYSSIGAAKTYKSFKYINNQWVNNYQIIWGYDVWQRNNSYTDYYWSDSSGTFIEFMKINVYLNSFNLYDSSHVYYNKKLNTARTFTYNNNYNITAEGTQYYDSNGVAKDKYTTIYYYETFDPNNVEIISNSKNQTVFYPNPTKGIINFNLDKPYQGLTAQFYDSYGRLVYTESIHGNSPINISHLTPQLYFVKIQDSQYKLIQSGTLMKE